MSLKNNIPCNNPNCKHKWYYENLPNGKGFRTSEMCVRLTAQCGAVIFPKKINLQFFLFKINPLNYCTRCIFIRSANLFREYTGG
jgi:hypothetical protein